MSLGLGIIVLGAGIVIGALINHKMTKRSFRAIPNFWINHIKKVSGEN